MAGPGSNRLCYYCQCRLYMGWTEWPAEKQRRRYCPFWIWINAGRYDPVFFQKRNIVMEYQRNRRAFWRRKQGKNRGKPYAGKRGADADEQLYGDLHGRFGASKETTNLF